MRLAGSGSSRAQAAYRSQRPSARRPRLRTTRAAGINARQSGVWPTQRSGGSRMRLHGLHGRSTRTTRSWRPAQRVARRIGRTEDGDDRRADGTGEVHRAGVARDEQIEPLEDRRQCGQVDVAGDVDHAASAQRRPHRLDQRPRPPVAPVSTMVAPNASDSRRATSANRLGSPLLDRAPAAHVHAHQRARRVAGHPRAGLAPARPRGCVSRSADRPAVRCPNAAETRRARVVASCARGGRSRARDRAARRRRRSSTLR